MTTDATLAKLKTDPAAFRHVLRVDTGDAIRPLGEVMDGSVGISRPWIVAGNGRSGYQQKMVRAVPG